MRRFAGGSPKPTKLDRWLLEGSDPGEPVGRLAIVRLRLLVAVSLAVAILGIGLMLISFQQYNKVARIQNLQELKEDCVDRGGDIALRHQWQEIIKIIEDSQAKDPAKRISQQQASKRFIASYHDALTEAGPPPDCIINVK